MFAAICAFSFLVNYGRVAFAPLVDYFVRSGISPATAGLAAAAVWVGSALPRLPTGWLLTFVSRERALLGVGVSLAAAATSSAVSPGVHLRIVGALLIGLAAVATPFLVAIAIGLGSWRLGFGAQTAFALAVTAAFVLAVREADMPDAGRRDRDLVDVAGRPHVACFISRRRDSHDRGDRSMHLRPGVYTYDVEWDYDEPLGIQVVETDQETVMFGGGTEAVADRLVEIAGEHDVDVVAAEHGDFDHYDGIPALRAAVDDLEVAAPAGDAETLAAAGIDVDHPLSAGETDWGIETISTPGHTPDNMSYLAEDVLVAGDTVVGAGSIFAADGDWSGPFAVCTPEYNADDEQTRESVSILADYGFETVLVSHGENVIEGGHEAIEALVDDLE